MTPAAQTKLHNNVLAILEEMKKTADEKEASAVTADYNQRRKDKAAELKPLLEKMDTGFKAGEKFGGCDSMKSYCAAYKSQGMYTYARVRQIITGTTGNERKGQVLDLTVALNGFTVNAKKGFAWVSVEISQEHKLTYRAKEHQNNWDYSQTPSDSNGEYEWIHEVRDLQGNLRFTAENEDGTLDTPEKLTAAVYEKMVAGLKSLRLWKDSLKKQFKDYVAEEVDWQEERKEVRSRAAKKGAATRKKMSESGFQKKLDALKEFNARNAGEAPATKTHVAGTNRVSDGIGWTLCGKAIHKTQKGEGAALIKDGEKPTCGTCLKHKGYLYGEIQKKNRKEQEQRKAEQEAAVEEKHTGQHEDCAECWEYEQEKQQQEERIEKKRSAAYKAWYKRIQTLIDTWRNFRLKEENKYREEFQKASDKYLARLKREGLDTRGVHGESIVKEARDRMEGAIADRNRFYPPTAPATAEESPVAPVAQALEQTIADTGGVEPKPWEQPDWKEKSWHDRILVPGSPEREEWKERCLRNAELQREIEIAEEDEELESEEGDESEEFL